ncbi:hypothetical protein ElyMa_004765400 [Elysia marginata]|uniref:Uncharacterized protein n=1 Tax=Elysia marginata TaxID=1093978 RepID=A0AAV4IE03_9GAST|nr:hypothetical protein ElyMa_004765400 [Elysia marginata]
MHRQIRRRRLDKVQRRRRPATQILQEGKPRRKNPSTPRLASALIVGKTTQKPLKSSKRKAVEPKARMGIPLQGRRRANPKP